MDVGSLHRQKFLIKRYVIIIKSSYKIDFLFNPGNISAFTLTLFIDTNLNYFLEKQI